MGEKTNLFPVFKVILEYDVADSYERKQKQSSP